MSIKLRAFLAPLAASFTGFGGVLFHANHGAEHMLCLAAAAGLAVVGGLWACIIRFRRDAKYMRQERTNTLARIHGWQCPECWAPNSLGEPFPEGVREVLCPLHQLKKRQQDKTAKLLSRRLS